MKQIIFLLILTTAITLVLGCGSNGPEPPKPPPPPPPRTEPPPPPPTTTTTTTTPPPPVCSALEVVSDCPNSCPPTCRRPNDGDCETPDCKPGCICKFGLLLDETTGQCVFPFDCPVMA